MIYRPDVPNASAAAARDRRPYHHGNLAEALLTAATDMAESGGPDAVVLREVARRVGVSATAAYRHFAGQEALQHAVKEEALAELARHMLTAVGSGSSIGTRRDRAVAALDSIGRAYFEFALDRPGLFRCFCEGLPIPDDVQFDTAEAFGVLAEVLDELVASGALAAERRQDADVAAWSAIHGLAMLCLTGPLADLPRADKDRLYLATSRMVREGLL